MNAQKILIVCFANICRSPTAEAVFHRYTDQLSISHKLLCDSAGCSDVRSGEAADKTAAKIAKKHGYNLDLHKARSIKSEDGKYFDYIVAVDTYSLLELREILPKDDHGKLSLLLDHTNGPKGRDVPDPYKKSKAVYEQSLRLIEEGVEGLINHLRLTHKI